ncbi:MAG TPA: N-acetylmuramoyl-L-alanine amidase [Alphaproteobacteria bacterium]
MDLDQEADFRAQVQADPTRLIVDMPILSGKPLIGRSALPDIIKDIRLEPLGTQHSRLNFILADIAVIRSAFMMPSEGTKPARLVVDLAPASDQSFAKAVGRAQGTLQTGSDTAMTQIDKPTIPFAGGSGIKLDPVGGPKPPSAPQTPKAPTKLIPDELPLVMIDAGHGGIDSGAVGNKVREKDVTLSVAQDIQKALEATGKYRAALTRDKDIFIRLGDRVKIARAADADLFVSIHADSVSSGGENIKGASFYTLSAEASDVQSARLAARENQADLLGGVELPTNDQDVKEILIDLAMRETTHQSKLIAGQMVKAFARSGIKTVPGPERSAGFMVLKAPDVPSLLIELGFLSNPGEAAKLGDTAYREELSRTIAGGIDAYFSRAKRP